MVLCCRLRHLHFPIVHIGEISFDAVGRSPRLFECVLDSPTKSLGARTHKMQRLVAAERTGRLEESFVVFHSTSLCPGYAQTRNTKKEVGRCSWCSSLVDGGALYSHSFNGPY